MGLPKGNCKTPKKQLFLAFLRVDKLSLENVFLKGHFTRLYCPPKCGRLAVDFFFVASTDIEGGGGDDDGGREVHPYLAT